ncbi:MAG: AMP-dependent synthetase [Brevundimonas sp.]|nr:MAG: AMP-dependent synthetase [Brevundimonas sp.]
MVDGMQPYELTVDKFLTHAARWHGDVEVVSCDIDGAVSRMGYADLLARSRKLSGALMDLDLGRGDVVATLAWNTRPHMEIWYAVMGVGMVCHTLNPRLTAVQLASMLEQSGATVLAYGAGLAPLAADIVARRPGLRLLALDERPAEPATLDIEDLIEIGQPVAWGGFDERSPAGLCFTSGTTGAPKGVVYTHRSNYLVTLRSILPDSLGLTRNDAVLVAVPMFHANAWGFPFSAPAVGAKLVLPGRVTDGPRLARLIREEGVTVTAGVPTVWLGLVEHVDAGGEGVPTLQRIVLGGAGCPEALMNRLEQSLGVRVQTSWGMTELSPTGTLSPPDAPARASGLTSIGLDVKLTDAEGVDLPEQRGVVGHLKVKGASVVNRYLGAPAPALDADGWFDTGDLARIDEAGALTIAGRSKDLIKSGGEWINPVEIEDIVGALDAVSFAAVIARPDAKWGERPVLVVELRDALPDESFRAALKGRVADWWIPERIQRVEAMPLAATGKIDKNRLRAEYGQA